MPSVEVNKAACTGCGVCVETCPPDVLRLDQENKALWPIRKTARAALCANGIVSSKPCGFVYDKPAATKQKNCFDRKDQLAAIIFDSAAEPPSGCARRDPGDSENIRLRCLQSWV